MEFETRHKLIECAKKLFAKKGFDGVSVKEICDLARVNISSVSYYFDGKAGLYQNVLEQFGKRRLEAAKHTLQNPQSEEELRLRLEMFASEFLRASAEEADLACIIHREMALSSDRAQKILRTTFIPVFECLLRYFASARETGLVSAECDTEMAATFFWGSLIHLVMSDGIRRDVFHATICDEAFRKRAAEQVSRFLIEGISPKKSGPRKKP